MREIFSERRPIVGCTDGWLDIARLLEHLINAQQMWYDELQPEPKRTSERTETQFFAGAIRNVNNGKQYPWQQRTSQQPRTWSFAGRSD